jgi:predicted glycosyltransferase
MQRDLALYPRLWIDLDNSPHVPLFAPLIGHLRSMGWPVRVTARDFAQTLDLVEQFGMDAQAVGAHAGKNKAKKVANLPVRAIQLVSAVRSFKPDIALSHGSRTQAIASMLLGIPQIVMFDYEWTEMMILKRLARHLVCPRVLTRERLQEAGIPLEKVEWYNLVQRESRRGRG